MHTSGCALILAFILFTFQDSRSQTEDGPLFEIEFDRTEVFLSCPKGCAKDAGADACNDSGKMDVAVKINSKRRSSRDSKIWFEYAPETGSITETEYGLRWNLGDAGVGKHWLKVKMNQGFETIESLSKSVDVGRCDCTCVTKCATVSLEADKSEVVESEIIMLRAVQTGFFSNAVYFGWNVANGEILSGQGSRIVRVRAKESGSGDLLVNLELTQPSVQCERLFQLQVPIIPDNENDQ